MEDAIYAVTSPIVFILIIMICSWLASTVECKPKAIDFHRKNRIGDKNNRFTNEVELNVPAQIQEKYDELNIITDDLPSDRQNKNKRKKTDDEVWFDYDQQQPDGFENAKEQAQLNLALEGSQIEHAMKTLGDYCANIKELEARCKEGLNNLSNPESDVGQNEEENQNLTSLSLKLNEEKYFETRARDFNKRLTNPYQRETDEEIAMRLQQEMNTEIENSEAKLASELRDKEIAKIREFKNRNIARIDVRIATERSRGAMESEIITEFETEIANLQNKNAKDDKNLPSESELEDMDFSDFSNNEIE